MSDYSFAVRCDTRRNVLYIDQHGEPTAADLLDLKEQFVIEAGKLHRGFAIVNDQRDMQPYDDEAMEVAKELVKLTNEFGVFRVIRIVPADLLSTVRISSTLVAGASRYTSLRVATPEEAEEALDSLSENPGP